MSDLNDLNRPVTTDTEPNVLDTLRAHIVRAATWGGWSSTANKVAGLMSGVTAAVSGGRSLRLYRRNDANTADEEVVNLPGVSVGGSATYAAEAGISNSVRSPDGDRTLANILPTTYARAVVYQFANATTVGTGGNCAGVMTYAPWDGTTSQGGDASYQLAFGSTAANGGGVPMLRLRKGIDTTWNSWIDLITSANIGSFNAGTATKLSTDRTNWAERGVVDSVVGQLSWKNYGNYHTIVDMSSGTAPDGSTRSRENPDEPWIPYRPTLMGWNGYITFGVRVDSARVADGLSGYTAANDAEVVKLSGAQTIAGVKTFSSQPVFPRAPVLGTVTPTTSGTAVQFAGLPAWAWRITALFSGVSVDGSNNVGLQLGSTTYASSGYVGAQSQLSGSAGSSFNTSSMIPLENTGGAAQARSGRITLWHMGGNLWVWEGIVACAGSSIVEMTSGSIQLAGALDRVQLVMNGANNFDGGSCVVFCEGS